MTICWLSAKPCTTKLFSIIPRERKKKLCPPSFHVRAWNDYLKNIKNYFNYSEKSPWYRCDTLERKKYSCLPKIRRKEGKYHWKAAHSHQLRDHISLVGRYAWCHTKIETVINVNRCTVSDSVATPLDDDWTQNMKHAPYGLWKWRTAYVIAAYLVIGSKVEMIVEKLLLLLLFLLLHMIYTRAVTFYAST